MILSTCAVSGSFEKTCQGVWHKQVLSSVGVTSSRLVMRVHSWLHSRQQSLTWGAFARSCLYQAMHSELSGSQRSCTAKSDTAVSGPPSQQANLASSSSQSAVWGQFMGDSLAQGAAYESVGLQAVDRVHSRVEAGSCGCQKRSQGSSTNLKSYITWNNTSQQQVSVLLQIMPQLAPAPLLIQVGGLLHCSQRQCFVCPPLFAHVDRTTLVSC